MDPIIGTIMLFAGNFQVKGFVTCGGQLMSIAQNTALFSILGTTYGGDGVTTFGIPDLRGRVPVGIGTGPGIGTTALGEMGGTQTTTLTIGNLPAHNHTSNLQVEVSSSTANTDEPGGSFLTTTNSNFYATTGTPGSTLGGVSAVIGQTGAGAPYSNLSPFLGMNYQIATVGIYPSRN